MNMVIVMTLQL